MAVVFGLRRERFPEQSIYNRMADIEWNMPMAWGTSDGTAQACGGDAMIRAEALRSVGGYNPSVPAGEEPELCRRLQGAGWMVVRVDANMTWHDAAMLRFRQWARRQFRTGYGGLDFTTRFGRGGDNPFRSQVRSPGSGDWAGRSPSWWERPAPGCSGGRSPAARPPGSSLLPPASRRPESQPGIGSRGREPRSAPLWHADGSRQGIPDGWPVALHPRPSRRSPCAFDRYQIHHARGQADGLHTLIPSARVLSHLPVEGDRAPDRPSRAGVFVP